MFKYLIRQSNLQSFRLARPVRFFSTADSGLVQKLKEEHKHELSIEQEPLDWLQDFKKQGIWDVVDKKGSKEVTLKRTFGKETISVLFSTDALAEQQAEMEGEEEEADAPVGVSIVVEKQGQKGALEITATAQNSVFYIDNVSFIPSATLAQDVTAEGDWSRRGLYSGPVFAELDETLIEQFHDYIEARGFNEELSEFISNYVVHKEQTEYVEWLKEVSNFVDQ